MSFYMKRSYVDTQPGIELVNIHYTWTPVGQQPNWEAHRETRAMPRGGVLVRGMGGTTLDETGNAIQTASQTVELPDDGTRRKVIRVPFDVWDPAQNVHVENYDLHHYFEVFREGKRELSPSTLKKSLARKSSLSISRAPWAECASTGASMIGTRHSTSQPKPTGIHREVRGRQPVPFVQILRPPNIKRISYVSFRAAESVADAAAICREIRGPKGAEGCAELASLAACGAQPAERWESYWGNNVRTL